MKMPEQETHFSNGARAIQMTDVQRKTVCAWLDDRKEVHCCCCQSTDWSIHEIIFELPQHRPPALITRQVFPVIPMSCSRCGHVLLLSAVALGIVRPNPG